MVGSSAEARSFSDREIGAAKAAMAEILLTEDFDPAAVVAEPLPPVVMSNGVGKEIKKREIVLGRNVHTTCLAVTEPEANDELTGDKDAYMASVLARYRKTLMERTKHHLGTENA